ncbi:hypothetical protein Mbo2_073 [Rhodococcus phage Mbo2]|uniref:Uncharacterized protein n=1 Tax=Rhodococcus phage Mbo2 TaxID=2936911 RepID=A0A9E7IN56_9CAUD|nr:hypothetical protein Mbo2_073 [Rhodococcus phage Mbo2]
MPTVTRAPALSKPSLIQRGKIMAAESAWMDSKINPGLEGGGVTLPRMSGSLGEVIMEYRVGGDQYQVGMIRKQKRVICSFCTGVGHQQVVWCRHLQYVASKSLDAPLWMLGEGIESHQFLVPIIPTEGVFALLNLVPQHQDYDNLAVVLKLGNMLDDTIDEIEIGFIAKGSAGMIELRSLFVDYLTGQSGNARYFYTAPLDSSLEQDPAVDRINQKANAFTQLFHLAFYGQSYGAGLLAPTEADMPTI